MDDHLAPETSDRGFQHMPPIETRHAATWAFVSVAESSAATDPHIWLTIEGERGHTSAHLTLYQARQLEEQLTWLRENHYQNEGNDE